MSPILGIWASQNYSRYSLPTSYESIATTTVGSGGASSVTFSSIPSTYTHLQIRAMGFYAASNNVVLQFNSDTGTNYVNHYLYADGSSVSAGKSGTNTGAVLMWADTSSGTSSVVSVYDLLDYTNTNKYKVGRTLHGRDANGSGYVEFFSNLWLNTSAISSITISAFGTTINQYSSFALYGIRGGNS